ncbi:hypothetical protein FORC31_p233 (plasmid) [Escherichia coli]|nr:hypothetical protein FORC31_p233 [Escherichia coli]
MFPVSFSMKYNLRIHCSYHILRLMSAINSKLRVFIPPLFLKWAEK